MPIPKLLVTAVLTVANMALTAMRKIEGPRLDDLKFTGGDYGAALPLVWGTRRLSCPIFHGEPLREVKRRRKTKGGKFNDYSYYGTFAFALADHEIQAVRRVWFDKHLVLDLSGAGPVTPFDFTSEDSGGKTASGTGAWLESEWFSIYLGTETQDVDPRMESYIESLHGEGSAPAYRGVAYVMVKDLPLEKFGNRIPQIEAEILSVSSGYWPYEEIDTDGGGNTLRFAPDFSLLWTVGTTSVAILDVAARTQINTLDFNPNNSEPVAPLNDGTAIGIIDGTDKPYLLDVYGGVTGPLAPNIGVRNLTGAIDVNGDAHWLVKADSTTNYYLDGALIGSDKFGQFMFADMDGALWMATHDGVVDTVVTFEVISGVTVGPATVTVSGLPSFANAISGAFHFRDATYDQFIFTRNGVTYAASRADGSILYTYSTSHGAPHYTSIRPGTGTFWGGFREFDSRDLTVIRTLTPSSTWGLAISVTAQVAYDPVNHALVLAGASGPQWLYLDRVSPQTVLLSDIMGDLADRVGVADYDYSDLDQEIDGWSVTQGQASSMAEPLLDTYDADQRPHEFSIEGLKRTGTASGATLETSRMLANEPRYTGRILQAAELPRSVTINFADINGDQQPNNARADRPLDATGARGEQTIDLTTLVLSADDAGQLARRWFRRKWNDRFEVEFGLSSQNLAIEPGDVRTIDLDNETISARCIRAAFKANGEIATEWRYDHPQLALLDSAAGAGFDGRVPDVISVPLLSRGFFLDIPLLTDADDQTTPAIYVAAAPIAAGTWPGAVAYQETGGEYTDEIASIPSGSAATWGYASTALPDVDPNVWDRGSSITITLQNGTLTGCTEADIDADETLNQMRIGQEIVQFTTATLTAPLTYTVSGFKRGRRGTEWACPDHAANETVLLLDTAQDAAMGLSEVGTNLSFKAITSGRTTGFPVDMEPFTGASLKPYAPCQLKGVRDAGTGDWTLTWVRRTRIGGAWTSGTSIPLSEASEEYEVEILNGSTVVRTITALSSPTTTYTAAQQTTDFGSTQTSLDWRVYQISAAVDRGFAAAA